jgi:flagellar L-ring protein precursor FlgH
MSALPLRVTLAGTLFSLSAACSTTSHINTYTPKRREFESPAATVATAPGSPGSLWPGRAPTLLFADARALRENDLVVIKIEEVADATHGANTDITRGSSLSATAAASQKGVSMLDLKLGGGLDTTFQGKGSTGRTEQLVATVPAVVRKVLPNGNLFVEGHRVVLVNSEEQHFYISGVVRPIDIEQDNSVRSSKVADAEIEFTGRGIVTDNQKQGVLSKYLGWVWPF